MHSAIKADNFGRLAFTNSYEFVLLSYMEILLVQLAEIIKSRIMFY